MEVVTTKFVCKDCLLNPQLVDVNDQPHKMRCDYCHSIQWCYVITITSYLKKPSLD